MFRIQLVFTLIFFGVSTTFAGEYNKTLDLGKKAPEWNNLPGVDGKKHSLSDLKAKEFVVVIFTCNSCPIAEGYEDRIIAFANQYATKESKVGVVAINVNTIPEDRLPEMQKRAKKKNFTFPYLFDETQKIAQDYGAKYTPEFFVLNKDREVVYMGAMDDKNNAKSATVNYLEKAVDSLLKGEKPALGETLGRGCMIRYNRKRD